jgi:septal ring factor EnvC (AmiA/AmiB activator)
MGRFRVWAAWLVAGLLGLVLLPASTLSRLQGELQRAKQAAAVQATQIHALQGKLTHLGAEQAALAAQLSQLGKETAVLEQRKTKVLAEIQALRHRVHVLRAESAITEAKVALDQHEVRRVMLQLYEEQSNRFVLLLSQSTNLYDLLIQGHYVNELGRYDLALIANLKRQVSLLAQQRKALASSLAQVEQLRTHLSSEIAQLTAEQQRQKQAAAQLAKSRQGQQLLLLRAAQEQRRLSAQVDQIVGEVLAERAKLAEQAKLAAEAAARRRAKLAAEQAKLAKERRLARSPAQRARITQEEQAIQTRQSQLANIPQALPTLSAQSGPLLLPIAGGRVAEPYGTQGPYVVISGTHRNSPVRASSSGQVLQAAYYANLGWVIVEQISNQLVAVYTGLQQPAVQSGSAVSAGELIGYTGGSPLIDARSFWFQEGVLQGNQPKGWISPTF